MHLLHLLYDRDQNLDALQEQNLDYKSAYFVLQ